MSPLRALLLSAAASLAACQAVPKISAFEASAATVEIGDPVTLSWRVIDAKEISITGVGQVNPPATYVTVTPAATASYVLTATNSAGSVSSAPVVVTVVPRLDGAAGVWLEAGRAGTTFAFVLRDAGGAPPPADTVVTASPPGGAPPFTATCPAGQPLCLASYPAIAPAAGQYQLSATIGGVARTASCTLNPSSRQFAADPIFSRATGATSVVATWRAAPGAASYRAQLLDGSGNPLGPAQVLTGTAATLAATSALPASYQVAVDAAPVDLSGQIATLPLVAPNVSRATAPSGGTADAWRLFLPSDFGTGTSLSSTFTALGPAEHLAVVVMNVDGADYVATSPANNVSLGVTGTQILPSRGPDLPLAPAAADGAGPPVPFARDGAFRRFDEEALERAIARGDYPKPELSLAPAALAPAPATASFCVRQGVSALYSRKTATLHYPPADNQALSPHVLFYVDDSNNLDFQKYEPGIWTTLEGLFEGDGSTTGIYHRDTNTFGPESDVDQNGKLIVFFSGELGAGSPGSGIVLGYYSSGDVLFARDTSAGCTGTQSNGADMFYLNDIGNIVAAGAPTRTASDVLNEYYPATLAHELQHLINFNAHCLLASCSNGEETWVNEGLSMVAEDVNGFGWATSGSRADGASYLDRMPSPTSSFNLTSYWRRSLTTWEGDPIGNYEGVHAYFRFWADRFGDGVLRPLVQGPDSGTSRMEHVLGMPFGVQMAEWTSALLFSNEAFNPSRELNFTGAPWTPLHTAVAPVNYLSLNPSGAAGAVRRDGWNAFLTGAGTGADAAVTVTSALAVKPHVLMVRFSGSLARCPAGKSPSGPGGQCQ